MENLIYFFNFKCTNSAKTYLIFNYIRNKNIIYLVLSHLLCHIMIICDPFADQYLQVLLYPALILATYEVQHSQKKDVKSFLFKPCFK